MTSLSVQILFIRVIIVNKYSKHSTVWAVRCAVYYMYNKYASLKVTKGSISCNIFRTVLNSVCCCILSPSSFYLFVFLLFLRLWFLWPEEANLRNKRSRNRCGCLGGCRFFGGTNMGLDFFKLEELTPSSSSAFSSSSADVDMSYGQSLLQPGEWIITKETPKVDGMDLQDIFLHFLIFPRRMFELISKGVTSLHIRAPLRIILQVFLYLGVHYMRLFDVFMVIRRAFLSFSCLPNLQSYLCSGC